MKKILFTLAAAFMMSGAAFAQGNGGGQRPQLDREQMIKMRTDRTVEQYKLNDEQAKQLLELNTKYADTLTGFGGRGRGQGGHPRMGGQGGPGGGFGQGGGGQMTPEQQAQREEMRKQREESTKAYNAELERILTPEQYKQYQEDQQNRSRRGGQRGGQRPSRGPRQQNQQNQQNI